MMIANQFLVGEITNTAMRGRGLGKGFLYKCIEDYLSFNKYGLTAKIKPQNLVSLKIFGSVEFE